ncbi:hypothetical protein C8R43DRAFT_1245317 [Mycena crocata]|nr:hypothetical protein C8R43DRAFT_1245317 [Mycena crocata]
MPSAAIPTSPSSRCPAPQSLIHFPFSYVSLLTQVLKLCTMARTGEHGNGARYAPLSHLRPSSLAYIPTQNLTLIHTPTRRRPLHTADIHCVPPLRHAHIRRECLPFHSPSPANSLGSLPANLLAECPRPKSASSTNTNATPIPPPAQNRPAPSLHLRPRVATHSHSAHLRRVDGW